MGGIRFFGFHLFRVIVPQNLPGSAQPRLATYPLGETKRIELDHVGLEVEVRALPGSTRQPAPRRCGRAGRRCATVLGRVADSPGDHCRRAGARGQPPEWSKSDSDRAGFCTPSRGRPLTTLPPRPYAARCTVYWPKSPMSRSIRTAGSGISPAPRRGPTMRWQRNWAVAAGHAHARNGGAVAATFLERAAVLTSVPELRCDRALAAARAKLDAGAFSMPTSCSPWRASHRLTGLQRARAARVAAQMEFAKRHARRRRGGFVEWDRIPDE